MQWFNEVFTIRRICMPLIRINVLYLHWPLWGPWRWRGLFLGLQPKTWGRQRLSPSAWKGAQPSAEQCRWLWERKQLNGRNERENTGRQLYHSLHGKWGCWCKYFKNGKTQQCNKNSTIKFGKKENPFNHGIIWKIEFIHWNRFPAFSCKRKKKQQGNGIRVTGGWGSVSTRPPQRALFISHLLIAILLTDLSQCLQPAVYTQHTFSLDFIFL